MKILYAVLVLGLGNGATAFVASPCKATRPTVELAAAKKWDVTSWAKPMAATVFGLTVASQVAFAGFSPETIDGYDATGAGFSSTQSSNVVLAVEKLDFSMPSYGSSSGGFGDGTEAYIGKEKSTESQLQMETMRKAEEARQARKAAKAAQLKLQEQINKQQALEKKQRDAEKTRAFFAGEY